MKRILTMAVLCVCAIAAWANKPLILPQPQTVMQSVGEVAIPDVITIAPSPEADLAVEQLQMRGFNAKVSEQSPFLTIEADPEFGDEAYTLQLYPKGSLLVANTPAAVYYGIETLVQMLQNALADGKKQIDACVIIDQPRFAYRGLMLDVVRCYLPIDEVKRIVDMASRMKLNTLHLHLTDDNGWRMEIQKYPKLTEVGAWRVDRPEIFPARANPQPGEPATYGGYYTQDELRSLVEYAARRGVTVVPEIEMPAHAIAAIASYPELGCPETQQRFVGVLPGIGGPDAAIIMCAGNDHTIEFVEGVLDEVMDVFPSEYIHLGGDEANKRIWENCELCKARVQELGLDGFEELQGWFMDSIANYVKEHGRKAIGWDEVTYGKPSSDMAIMGWQGDGHVAVDYAKANGNPFIMTPALKTYLIRYQGPQWFEPFTYFGNITLRDAYEFEPVEADWSAELESQLMGIQGSMWTEFCRTPADVQRQIFPRLLAIADAAWREKGRADGWEHFVEVADAFLPSLDEAGIAYAKSMYNIQHTARPQGDGTVRVAAECLRPDAVIVLANGRTAPNPLDTVIGASGGIDMVAEVGERGQDGFATGKILSLTFDFNKATGRSVSADKCNNKLEAVLTNGLRGSHRNSDFEWAGWHNGTAEFTVDLGSEQDIKSVKLGALANANLCIAFPKAIRLYAIDANGNEQQVGEVTIPVGEAFPPRAVIKDFELLAQPVRARSLRVEADNSGRVLDGYPRATAPTWIYFDEIMVE